MTGMPMHFCVATSLLCACAVTYVHMRFSDACAIHMPVTSLANAHMCALGGGGGGAQRGGGGGAGRGHV